MVSSLGVSEARGTLKPYALCGVDWGRGGGGSVYINAKDVKSSDGACPLHVARTKLALHLDSWSQALYSTRYMWMTEGPTSDSLMMKAEACLECIEPQQPQLRCSDPSAGAFPSMMANARMAGSLEVWSMLRMH